ncbi:Deuterolysin metalloprotease family-domain-containing protein [Pyronema domesticum]|uniref:Neutral protease 2 n=1 Tax=Pyronema omphalodes (strain CBS 100304) TaxID=1076935 RepID=U4L280_PYROM|nr:Deuterolysin metalloprotease family-domain-containing protein [Pyronema domesticum]CCX06378.1 Similar to Neutral protease 2; acc. no. P46076 [Pyronema omphalodes CBS 100304]
MFSKSILPAFISLFLLTVSSPLRQISPGITVSLSPVQDAVINAVITNHGFQGWKILKHNSLLSPELTRTVEIYDSHDHPLNFEGFTYSYDTGSLNESDYISLGVSQSFETTIDLKKIYKFPKGETKFQVKTEGVFEAAPLDSTANTWEEYKNLLPYQQEKVLEINVGIKEAKVEKRMETVHCTPERQAVLQNALQMVAYRANLTAFEAIHGDPETFQRYFKTTLPDERLLVARKFHKIALEADPSYDTEVTYSCGDVDGICQNSKYLAFAMGRKKTIANCDGFYELPVEAKNCHKRDQWSVVLHELTHIFFHTKDHAYGYGGSVRLDEDRALENADSYTLYAQELFQPDCER